MTEEDAMKFCEKGSHEYEVVDVVKSLKGESMFLVYRCGLCPSRWLKDL